MALPRKYRLARKDSEYVFRKGETVKSSFFFIRFLKNQIGHCRLAIVASAKVSKSSAVRNRLRRMVAEIFKAADQRKRPLDIVFIATQNIVGRPFREIKSELTSAIGAIFVNPERGRGTLRALAASFGVDPARQKPNEKNYS